ncbi:MAG: hypothetical protein WC314_21855 [Vulcanimicrobiota bacterium]
MSHGQSDKESLEDKTTRLYLERTPSAGSQREFDEVVPEFMHRAFYRSTDDEFQAVEPSEVLRSKRRVKFVERSQRPPIDPEPEVVVEAEVPRTPNPLRSPEPPRPQEPLSPLRQSAPEAEAVESPALRVLPEPPQTPPPAGSWPPTPARKTGLNYPLLICLLALVSLFVWREQTRPEFPSEQPLPLPRAIPVSEQPKPDAPELSEESPYPEMSPEVAAPNPEEPIETAIEDPADPVDPERAATLAEETAEESPSVSAREASAQRAAIMERMSDGTVSNSERTSRPAQETSLFPVTEAPAPIPPARPQPPTAQTQAPVETAVESNFPSEAPPPAVSQKPPVVPVQAPAPPVQGEPYQIAEPSF